MIAVSLPQRCQAKTSMKLFLLPTSTSQLFDVNHDVSIYFLLFLELQPKISNDHNVRPLTARPTFKKKTRQFSNAQLVRGLA